MQTSTWQTGTRRRQFRRWEELEDAVIGQIPLLQEDSFRYLVLASPTRYVQLAALPDGTIHGEASSHDDQGVEFLSAASRRRLLRMGWERPLLAAARDSRPAKNLWRRWHASTPDAIAGLVVKTLRDGFEVASPSELTIRRASFSADSLVTVRKSGQWVSPVKNFSLRLRPGTRIQNAHSGRQYEVGKLLGHGGFGAAYHARQIGKSRPRHAECVLKVSIEPHGWHREAYFGELLQGEPGIVSVHETFAWVAPGRDQKPLYCLVSEFAEGGDLGHYLSEHPRRWTESKARREITRLARAVRLLHASGAVHRDITPRNVLVTPGGVLKLGDFGIALHRAGSRHVAADAFNPWFAPSAIKGGETVSWKPADDVYQLGQLFAFLLIGSAKSPVTPREVRTLSCSAEAKSIIQRCIGERRRRFANAEEMLAGMEGPASRDRRRRIVRSVSGKRVVFTGTLAILRKKARLLVKKAGGIVENNISRATDIVVVGETSPNWKADKKGRKLLDVDRERELGHDIAVISERRFRNLIGLE